MSGLLKMNLSGTVNHVTPLIFITNLLQSVGGTRSAVNKNPIRGPPHDLVYGRRVVPSSLVFSLS